MLSAVEAERIIGETMRRQQLRARPVDLVYRDAVPRQGVLVALGMQAQAALGVFDPPHRDGIDLASYERSEWATLRTLARNLAQTALLARFTAAATNTLAITDTSGAARTLAVSNGAGTSPHWFNSDLNTTGDNLLLRWGSNNTAPTGTDNALTAEVDLFPASTYAVDAGLIQTQFSGSKVYAGANTTAREAGFSMNWRYAVANLADFLFDHATLADQAVNTGQTVALTYTVQY